MVHAGAPGTVFLDLGSRDDVVNAFGASYGAAVAQLAAVGSVDGGGGGGGGGGSAVAAAGVGSGGSRPTHATAEGRAAVTRGRAAANSSIPVGERVRINVTMVRETVLRSYRADLKFNRR